MKKLNCIVFDLMSWHQDVAANCELMMEHADKPMVIPGVGEIILTAEEQRGFRIGLTLAMAWLGDITFKDMDESADPDKVSVDELAKDIFIRDVSERLFSRE
ncbi:hypothetical protein ABXW99_000548 [Salmonella enterica]|nr:hypothetical protein [Salmonella enterica subsp. enterica serovar Muenchen]